MMRNTVKPIVVAFVTGGVLLCLARSVAHADTVAIGNLTYNEARITDIRDGEIYFITGSGRTDVIQKPLGQVVRISVRSAPELEQAEEHFLAQRWGPATDVYHNIFTSTQPKWLKLWIALRMVHSAEQSKDLRRQVIGWTFLVLNDTPQAAKSLPPAPPDPKSATFREVLDQVKTTLATAQTDEQKRLLLNMLEQLYKANGDVAAAADVQMQILKIIAQDPNNPDARQAAAKLRLSQAQIDINENHFDDAVARIAEGWSSFQISDDLKAQALYTIAEAHLAAAKSRKARNDWLDAALAYMRVVAHVPAHPLAAESLLKTGTCHESLQDPATAAKIYGQLVQQFPDSPAAAQARQRLASLNPTSQTH